MGESTSDEARVGNGSLISVGERGVSPDCVFTDAPMRQGHVDLAVRLTSGPHCLPDDTV
jgi:hypothetical protein